MGLRFLQHTGIRRIVAHQFDRYRVILGIPDRDLLLVRGVPDELGDEEIKLFVRAGRGARVDIPALAGWCAAKLAAFQVPRYYAVVDEFEKTGTHRIRKEALPRTTTDAWTRAPDGTIAPPENACPHPRSGIGDE